MASSIENFEQYGLDTDEVLWTGALQEIRTCADISSYPLKVAFNTTVHLTRMLIQSMVSFSTSSIAQNYAGAKKLL